MPFSELLYSISHSTLFSFAEDGLDEKNADANIKMMRYIFK